MPKIIDLAQEVLGEIVANSLNTTGCLSAEEFLKKYDLIKEANKHTVGEQNMALLRCAVLSKHRCLVRSGQSLSRKALEQSLIFSTGSSELDKLLGGGFYTSEVTEIYGPSGQGKTQLSLHTSMLACFKKRCNVVYIDTSNSFSSTRASEILHKYNSHGPADTGVLKKLMVCPIFDVFDLQDFLYNFITTRKSKENEFYVKVKLIIIDNITSLLASILGYRSPEGYAIASSVSNLLRRVAVEQQVAVLVVNGTVTGQTATGLPKPALGIHWQQTADKQLLVSGYNDGPPLVYKCQLTASWKLGSNPT